MMSKKIKRVAILVESSRAFGRGLIQGISSFALTQDDWQLCYREATLEMGIAEWLEDWKGDGIIARPRSLQDVKALERSGIPTVDLLGEVGHSRLTTIVPDNLAIAQLAVDFLIRAGFKQLAFCGYPGIRFSDEREKAFVQEAQQQGLVVNCYMSGGQRSSDIPLRETWSSGREDELREWLRGLEQPVAILACNDVRALELSSVCRVEGIHVPESVSILGIDDDELICEMSHPPLSSIQPDLAQQGAAGAEALLQIMKGGRPDFRRLTVPPIKIVERPSTDVLVSDDERIIASLRFVRENYHRSIGADDVADHIGVSRSLLDQIYKSKLGFTVSQEIRRLRLSRVKHLLRHSDLTLVEIARCTGFSSSTSLSHFFKSFSGMSPGVFRESMH